MPAIIAVALDWDVVVVASFVLAYALYFAQVIALVFLDREDGKVNLFRVALVFMQTGLLGYFALSAILSACNQQAS